MSTIARARELHGRTARCAVLGTPTTIEARLPPVWPALSIWLGTVAVGVGLVQHLNDLHRRVSVATPPLHAVFSPGLPTGVVWAAVVGSALAGCGPRLARSLAWRTLLVASSASTLLWGGVVAASRGADRIFSPVRLQDEYWAFVPRVHDLGSFLSGYAARLAAYPVHVQGHPPGTVVLLWLLGQVGLSNAAWVAGLFVGVGVMAVPAVLIAAREVGGESWARRAAPFVVLAPTVIWIVTSADAFFMGVATWGVALVVVATGRRDTRGVLAAVAGGLLLALCAYFSYGLVLVWVIPLAVAWHRRRLGVAAWAVLGAVAVVVAWTAAGFWWLDGLSATRARYYAGVGGRRPYLVFLVANLSALAVALGPAIAVGLARLRDRSMWVLVGAALAAVVLADLSGMAKGEVERIWLPFTPWLLLAGASLVATSSDPTPGRRNRYARNPTTWLAAQALCTILIESLVRTPW